MKTVLWLMYLADFAASVSVVCVIVGIVTAIVWAVKWIINAEEDFLAPATESMPPRKALWLTIILFSIAALLPSSKTIYAIAAVQAGDAFASSERGEKVLRALDSWLDRESKKE